MERFSDFKEFIDRKIKKVTEKKEDCKIILYGSYFPKSEKRFLKKVKQDIIKEGYKNTFLVEDFPKYSNLSVREKSLLCLEFSDINIFIITFKGKQGGLTVELEHIIKNASSLSFKTIVAFECKVQKGTKVKSLSPLHEDGLKYSNIKLVPFNKNKYKDFFELLRAHIWNKHYHLVVHEKKY